jgi:hypothetical protein
LIEESRREAGTRKLAFALNIVSIKIARISYPVI